ncbi:MAG: hypothetical protein RIM33_13675 [Alphaproteobacteria bacterium]
MLGIGKALGWVTDDYRDKKKIKYVEKRKVPRFGPNEIRLRISGKELPVQNISVCGVFMMGIPTWFVSGQGIVFELMVPVRGEFAPVLTQGRVTRIQGGGAAVHYRSPHPNWTRLMTNYLSRS